MKKMDKRGQEVFGMSFGVIFSIVIIIAIIAVAFYVISSFLSVNSCGQIGIFYEDLQERVDEAYGGGITQDVFVGEVPEGIEYICIGKLENNPLSQQDRQIHTTLKSDLYGRINDNIFAYPSNKACDGELAYNIIDHVNIAEFSCIKVMEDKVSLRVSKGNTEALVTLSK